MKRFYLTIFAVLLFAAGCSSSIPQNQTATSRQIAAANPLVAQKNPTALASNLVWPISNALYRVTKKTFGLYVTPQNSPVQPEKFTGFHTGTDFETTPEEKNIKIPIIAICTGKLLLKKYATGYGGVAVQSCTINSQAVTVIYGHLKESSINPLVGQLINAGDQIAILGTGYSAETDGERKHLHLGIHKGTDINILGYVQKKADLANWLDPLTVLK